MLENALPDAIAEVLGRTVSAVKSKAHVLGITIARFENRKRRDLPGGAEGEGEMCMKAAVGILALLFATSAFAQSAPPKAGKKPAAQARPAAPMGCKLVGHR